MAILPGLNGIDISITVDNEALNEYEDRDDPEAEGSITRYIEAVNGQTFAIRIRVNVTAQFQGSGLSFQIYIDNAPGHGSVDNPLIARDEVVLLGEVLETSEGVHVRGRRVQRYRFSDVTTTSTQNIPASTLPSLLHLGRIRVEVHHIDYDECIGDAAKVAAPQAIEPVPESALKGRDVSHSVGYVAEHACQPQSRLLTRSRFEEASEFHPQLSYMSYRILGDVTKPAGVYNFQYRSLAALKSAHIVNRTPEATPEPTPMCTPHSTGPIALVDRDPATLSQEDIIELQRSLRATQGDSKVGIKREQDVDSGSRQRNRARTTLAQLEMDDEGTIRESSVPTLAGDVDEGPVIDLTEESSEE